MNAGLPKSLELEGGMESPVRILIAEDRLADFELAQHEIRHALTACEFHQVETSEDFIAAIHTFQPDLIISDYNMPRFDGMSALRIAQQESPLTPVIIWTGSLNEDTAVLCMKAGASNYVLKEQIKRLGPAVVHALEEKQVRLERLAMERALQQNELRFRAMLENSADGIILLAPGGTITYASDSLYRIAGYTPAEAVGQDPSQWIHPDDLPYVLGLLQQIITGGGDIVTAEYRVLHKDGSWRWVETTINNLLNNSSINGILFNFHDVTQRKRAEDAEREQRNLAEALRDTAAALNSTLDFDTVLDQILLNAHRVVPHDASTILMLEDDSARVVRSRGYEAAGSEKILAVRLKLADTPSLLEMAATGKPLLVPDTRTYPGWRETPVTWEQRSAISAPILGKGKLLGFISLDSFTPNVFHPNDTERLLAFANQAAVAIENSLLLRERDRRLNESGALNRISSALRAATSLDEMLPLLLQEIIQLLNCDSGGIWLYDEQTETLQLKFDIGWGPVPITTVKSGELIPGHVLATGKPYVRRDLRTDPSIPDSVRDRIPENTGAAAVPLRAYERVIGVIFITTSDPQQITDEQVRLFTTMAEIAGIAIQRTRLFEETHQQLERLSALRAVDLAISGSLDLNLVLKVVLEQAITHLHVDAASILLLNQDSAVLEYAAGKGFRTHEIERTSLRLHESHAGRAVLNRTLTSVTDLKHGDPVFNRQSLVALENFVSYYALPLVVKGTDRGVLEVFHRKPLTLDDHWVSFLEALAGQAAIAIDSAELFSKLQRSNLELALAYDTTLEGWSRALDLRDHETEGHTRRVTETTLRLARALNVDKAQLVQIRRGALLHDIGKMGIPDSILLKPGALTEDEWEIMRKHPVYAYELLSEIPYLRPALDIPYAHHEKWDGTGYPRGLRGEQIPFAARLFAIVDVWDALLSDRPYRPAWSQERVIAHIESLAGTHFDPTIVPVFLQLLAQDT